MEETQTTIATTTTSPAADPAAVEQPSAEQVETKPEAAQTESPTAADIEKMIQRAVDRATNKLGNDNKNLRSELEKERRKNLSDKEIKDLELQEKEKQIADRERALTEKENRLFAIKAIKEAGLDDGSDASLAIVDFVIGEDEETTTERVKTFSALIERIVKVRVDGVFKANGRTPGVGSETAANAGGQNDSLAVRMARNTASANKAAQTVLDHYIGGKN